MKSYIPFLSLRYLWFHKVSSGLGILGVTLGVGMVIVVVGVMDGFQTRLKNSLIGNTAAVVVRPHYDVDAELLVKALKEKVPGVLEASPIVATMTLITPEGVDAGEGLPCQVVGIDAAREDRVSGLRAKLRRGETPNSPLALLESASLEQPFRTPDADRARERRIRSAKQGVIVGRSLLSALGVGVGGQVQVFTLKRRKEGADGSKRELTYEEEVFRVTGAFRSGDYEIDDKIILMDRRDAVSFFREGMDQEVKEVRLLLDNADRCDDVKQAVREHEGAIVEASLKKGGRTSSSPLLEVKTWKELHWLVLKAVRNERGLLLVIASFSFIVVAFLIGSTQSMLVVEKTREIGVLRSLGASVAGTSGVFVGNGFMIGTLGALAGWGLGVSITSNIQRISNWLGTTFGLNLFPEEVYRFDAIPIDVKGDFVLSICAGAVLFALVGSILPAVRASLLDPVESLHHE